MKLIDLLIHVAHAPLCVGALVISPEALYPVREAVMDTKEAEGYPR